MKNRAADDSRVKKIKDKLKIFLEKIEIAPWYVRIFIGSWLSLYTAVIIWCSLTSWNPIFYNNLSLILIISIITVLGYLWIFIVTLLLIVIKNKNYKKVKGKVKLSLIFGSHLLMIIIGCNLLIGSILSSNYVLHEYNDESIHINKDLNKYKVLPDIFSFSSYSIMENLDGSFNKLILFSMRYNVSDIAIVIGSLLAFDSYDKYVLGGGPKNYIEVVKDIESYSYSSKRMLKNETTTNYNKFLLLDLASIENTLHKIYKNYSINKSVNNECKKYYLSNDDLSKDIIKFIEDIHFDEKCVRWNIGNIAIYNFTVLYVSRLDYLIDHKLISKSKFNTSLDLITKILISFKSDKSLDFYSLNADKIDGFIRYINTNRRA